MLDQCVCGRYETVGGIVTCRGSQMKTEQLEHNSEDHYPLTEIEHLLSFSRWQTETGRAKGEQWTGKLPEIVVW